jgi:2-oxoglutarate ferredoxin oxidoreductase subunit delta
VESANIPIALDHRLCKACGICVAICPNTVYDRDHLGYPVIARPDSCIQCLRCELHCPDFAIEIVRRERKRPVAAKKAAVAGPAPRRRAAAPPGPATAAAAGVREFTPSEVGGRLGVDPGACGDEGTG